MRADSGCVSHASHASLQLLGLLKDKQLLHQGTMHDLLVACSMPVCSMVRVSHLQAYVLDPEGPYANVWYHCNDGSVTRQVRPFHPSECKAACQYASLLIYQAQDAPPLGPVPVESSRSVVGCTAERPILTMALTSRVHAMLGDAPP